MMRARWERLSDRDQRALRIGAIACGVLGLLALASGRYDTHRQAMDTLESQGRQLSALQQRLTGAAGAAPEVLDSTRYRGFLEQALSSRSIDAVLQTGPEGGWYLELENVELSALIALERRLAPQGVRMARYRLKKGAADGQVSGRVEWQAP